MNIQKSPFPTNSLLSQTKYNYFDSYLSEFSDPKRKFDILLVAKSFMSASPKWLKTLFALRNKIAGVFGLKTAPNLEDRSAVIKKFNGQPGEKLGFFKVYQYSENEIILGEDDTHLDFRVSLLLEPQQSDSQTLQITTTVIFHNFWGKLYFLPVKPFHRLIVPVMIKGIIKEIENQRLI